MEKLINTAFSLSRIPTQHELVKFDGFDQLGKESAVERFLGKSWEEFLEKIPGVGFGTGSDIEELQVLESYGLQYYLKSYLLYCVDSKAEPRYENETVFFLIWTLKEIFRIKGVDIFTVEQRPVIRQFADFLLNDLKDVSDDEIFVKPMKEHLNAIMENLTL